MEEIKQRMEELANILEEANYNYYVLDNPTITDQEFDSYLRELETKKVGVLSRCRKSGVCN